MARLEEKEISLKSGLLLRGRGTLYMHPHKKSLQTKSMS